MRHLTTAPRSNGHARASRDTLEVYFHDVAGQRLLTAAEEVRLAREIESFDVETWTELLGYPATVGYVVDLLAACMDNCFAELRALPALAAKARRSRRVTDQHRLTEAARQVGRQLRKLDLDRRYRDVVLSDLRRLRQGEDRTGRGRLPFGARSQAFGRYLERAADAARRADRTRTRFVTANLRLVLAVARKYDLGAMPFADLVQEGNLGLIKAVDRFDHRRGLRFSTYATWWIRHNVGRAIAEKSRTIRLPVHITDSKARIARVQRSLAASLGRKPTTDEVADATCLSPTKVDDVASKLPVYQLSLDAPVGDEQGRARIDVFRDPEDDRPSPFDDLATKHTRAMVRGLLDKLKPVEADILRQRFGLADDRERTLQEIADQYQLSRERIRQIQERAFHKLRRVLVSIERD